MLSEWEVCSYTINLSLQRGGRLALAAKKWLGICGTYVNSYNVDEEAPLKANPYEIKC